MATPTREDKFSFGLWTVGWQARDLFGEATRPVLAGIEAVHKLSELGAYGITFHDDDLVPPGQQQRGTAADHRRIQGGAGRDRPGRAHGHHEPVRRPGVQGRRLHQQRPSVRRYALRKVMRNMDLAAEFGAQIYVFWGGREGSEVDFAKDVRAALDRYREGIDLLAQYSIDNDYGMRFAHRAQAERAPRRHPAALDRPRPGVHQRARARRHGRASTPRPATSRWRA